MLNLVKLMPRNGIELGSDTFIRPGNAADRCVSLIYMGTNDFKADQLDVMTTQACGIPFIFPGSV